LTLALDVEAVPPRTRRSARPAVEKGKRVTSIVSLRTFANSTNVPIVVFVDMQREYLAKPRLLAIAEIDPALDNCRKVLDHSRKIGLPVAFIRMFSESAFSTAQRRSCTGSTVSNPTATKWCSSAPVRRAILASASPRW
jgi:hypothetical protein